jgi:hypothetical protein
MAHFSESRLFDTRFALSRRRLSAFLDHQADRVDQARLRERRVATEIVMAQTRDWKGMKDMSARLLHERTGQDLETWNQRITSEGFTDEQTLRAWLTEQGVIGYAQALLVMERFGYPDFFLASADELIEGQYAERPQLRPIFDAIIDAAAGLGEVIVQTRKTYVSLVTPRRTFARVAGMPGQALWSTKSGLISSSITCSLPPSCASSTRRRTIALFCCANSMVTSYETAKRAVTTLAEAGWRRIVPKDTILARDRQYVLSGSVQLFSRRTQQALLDRPRHNLGA